ncbi:MAG TPA: universal stress protein [Gaiellales bacterium]|nr:universal stress protein [Gaiellales bacterium]
MYRIIVLAMDASEGAKRALPTAVEMARAERAELVIAHARTHAIEPDIEAELRRQVDELSATGLRVRLEIGDSMFGEEAAYIASVAEAQHADVIVIANRGRSRVAEAVMGSVTLRLLHLAKCAVLVVPAHAPVPTQAAPAMSGA